MTKEKSIKEYLERLCWGIELTPGILVGKGWFAWPKEPCEEGLMIALFKTRSKARKALKRPNLKQGTYRKARVVRIVVKLEWKGK